MATMDGARETRGGGPGAPRRPRAALLGTWVALGLLGGALVFTDRARGEWRAHAEAAAAVAARERGQADAAAERAAQLARERAEFGAGLDHARHRVEVVEQELVAARAAAYRARLRSADLALDLGRLDAAAEALGEAPPADAGLEWHLLERARGETLRELERRDEPVSALALAGDLAAVGDLVGGLVVLSPAGPRTLTAGTEPHDSVRALAFDASGAALALASSDWSARVFDLEGDLETVDLAGHYGPVNAAVFVGGRGRVATGGEDGTLRLWDLERPHEEVWLVEAHGGPLLALAADPRGERIASAAIDLEVRLWSARDGAPLATFEGHRDWIPALAFSGDGRRLASASDDGTARVWDVESGQELARLEAGSAPLLAVWLDAAGEVLVSAGEDGAVRRYEVRSGIERARWELGRWGLRTAAFAPDGEALLVSRGEGDVARAGLRRPSAWEELTRIEGARVLALDGAGHLGVGAREGTLTLCSSGDGRVFARRALGDAPVSAVGLAAGPLVAAGLADGALLLLEGSELAPGVRLAGHGEGVAALRLAADGRWLASASFSGELCLWDTRSGERLAHKPGPRQLVLAVALEPRLDPELAQGAWVAGAGLIRSWHLASGERGGALRVPELGRVRAAALAPGGAYLLTIDANEVLTRIDLAGSAPPARTAPHAARLVSLALSPDGQRAATGALDGGLDLWDARRAEHLLHVPGPPGSLDALTFAPDGATLAAVAADGRILLLRGTPP